MTTFLFTTTSNAVTVTDVQAVEALLDEYEFCVDPIFDETTGMLSFQTTDELNGFDVDDPSTTDTGWCTREFLEELAPYLEETFTIKSVETQGHGEASASKWIVEPDGTVDLHHF